MTTISRRLLVFAREPIPGQVKTRLIPHLGPSGAATVYQRLLQIALHAASQCAVDQRELWLSAAPQSAQMHTLAERHRMTLQVQRGADLGRRMARALQPTPGSAPHQIEHAVLIGSDCPGYEPDYLAQAFAALQSHDAVIGPATDGGYVLIGLSRWSPALFDAVPWGGPDVLATTRSSLRGLGWRWHELTPLPDIDVEEDLVHLDPLRMQADSHPRAG